MRIPKQCDSQDCLALKQQEINDLKIKHKKEHAALIELIDSQSKIIVNMTHQIQITATQVVSLTDTMKRHFNK